MRWAMRQADRHDVVIPEPSVTAAQLRAWAEQEATAAPDPWSAFLAKYATRRGLFIGASVAIGATVIGFTFRPSAAIAAPGHLDIDFRAAAKPAGDPLRELARSLDTSRTVDANYRSTYVHLQRWSIDTIHPAPTLVAQDVQTWWNADLSGTELQTTLPPQSPGRSIAEYLDELPPGARQDAITYKPGEFSDLIGTPSRDPAELKSQLDRQEPPANGPQATVRAVADVTAIHYLRPVQRVAMLTVLADVPGLLWRGTTKDRAGRPCVAVSIDSGGEDSGLKRDLLLIDVTGVVLGHEVIALTRPPKSPIADNTVIEYTLCLLTEGRP
jgi:hypothetical protein